MKPAEMLKKLNLKNIQYEGMVNKIILILSLSNLDEKQVSYYKNLVNEIKQTYADKIDVLLTLNSMQIFNGNFSYKKYENEIYEFSCTCSNILLEKYKSVYLKEHSFKNSDQFIVPENHYFFLGDNRDCSKDSRFLSSVGYVHKDNLVGKAQFIFFSSDKSIGNIFEFWKWNKSIRSDRFFKKIN